MLYIGTSGWTYAGWRGPFYPKDIPKRNWLAWYAAQFASTEINGSFYRTPSLNAVEGWRVGTPQDFCFAWKASKFITHWKRLSEKSKNSLELLESRLTALGKKAGPVLFQLSPQFQVDAGRLASFLELLPKRRRYAFEFRHPSWYQDLIFDLLATREIALCLSDHADAPSPWVVTARHVYLRGHGPSGRYRGRYPESTLRRWAKSINEWQSRNVSVYCYFDNDQKSAAPKDAKRLVSLLESKLRTSA
jgi:uncharacterized protein YecE (DUF72 family)